MSQIIHIKSIAEAYSYLHAEMPPHPLITLIRRWPKSDLDLTQVKFSSDLYMMSLKREIRGSFQYGRNAYDFQEGTMIFIGPGQVAKFEQMPLYAEIDTPSTGWTILFHPDLFRKSELGRTIDRYSTLGQKLKFIVQNPITVMSMVSPEEGAATQTLVSIMPKNELINGAYYTDCKVTAPAKSGEDMADAARLFDYCDKTTHAFQ